MFPDAAAAIVQLKARSPCHMRIGYALLAERRRRAHLFIQEAAPNRWYLERVPDVRDTVLRVARSQQENPKSILSTICFGVVVLGEYIDEAMKYIF